MNQIPFRKDRTEKKIYVSWHPEKVVHTFPGLQNGVWNNFQNCSASKV